MAWSTIALLACAGLVAAEDGAAAGSVVARWIQLAPGASAAALAHGSWGDDPASLQPTILARAIVTDAAACPNALLDHATPLKLHQRFVASMLVSLPGAAGAPNGQPGYPAYFVSPSARAPARFANGTAKATTQWGECEAIVPPGHATLTLDGTDLKLPAASPRRILVMADTGCRMSGSSAIGGKQQNCADPAAFPWAELATYEASFRPDLILHVGDWFYRDTNCLDGDAPAHPGCNDEASPNYEPWGDTFDAWNADVFFPAQPLLAAAPWVMVRGNHESCGRGARGWYATLDPYPVRNAAIACAASKPGAATGDAPPYTADFEPSYVIAAGGINLIVHDSSFANDRRVDPATATAYDMDLSLRLGQLQKRSSRPIVFATHKPTFGLVYAHRPDGCATGPGGTSDESGNWTEQSVFNGGTGYAASAFRHGVPSAISLFVSGHIHQFQYFDLGGGFAPQLIVGTGGTLLDADCNTGGTPTGKPFRQVDETFVVQKYAAGTSAQTMPDALSYDGFAFAVLDAITDKAGNTTGYDAAIYKLSTARAGTCRITLAPRSLHCDF